MDRRRALRIAGPVSLALVAFVALMWWMLATKVRHWWWDQMAARPPDAGDVRQLAQCDPPTWYTWLKVVTSDIEIGCGEAWGATALADRLGSDRATWLAVRVADPTRPAGTRMRGAMALSLAEHETPMEPAWLFEQLPPTRQAMWVRAAVESEPVALHAGPLVAGLAMSARSRLALVSAAEALPAIEWLAVVDDGWAEAEATLAGSTLADGFPELVAEVRSRRAQLRPVAGRDGRWSSKIAKHTECEPRCGALWADLLETVVNEEVLEGMAIRPADPEEHPRVAQILATLGASGQERRAVAHALQVSARWVRASPDPAARLRSLAGKPATGVSALARFPWDGAGSPFLSSVMVAAIGDLAGVPVQTRVGNAGQVWNTVGGVPVPRLCPSSDATLPAPPDTAPWPPDAVLAAALTELAASVATGTVGAGGDPMRALRLATAAERIDPLVAGPLAIKLASAAPVELSAGRRIGVGLLRPVSPPTGADAGRRYVGEHGPLVCE